MQAIEEADRQHVDVLAIAAHRDDVEQTCGGTLLRMAARGLRTAILDLTRGEAGTRGTAEDRAREADKAAQLLGVNWRQALDLADGAIENTLENRIKIVGVLREIRPRGDFALLASASSRPRHRRAAGLRSVLSIGALQKIESGSAPHRPFKIIYASLVCAMFAPASLLTSRPSSSSGIRASRWHTNRNTQIRMHRQRAASFPEEEIRERTFAEARHYGLLAGVKYGEPFVQKEVGLVDDLTLLAVQSI